MRVALLADIHGNARALEAVVADLATRAPDVVVNLGDCLSGPLQAADTADHLMALGWTTVRGNHDRTVLGPRSEMGPSDLAADAQLTDAHRRWLASLPASVVLDDLFLCHGRPTNDLAYLLESVEPSAVRSATSAEIEDRLRDVSHAVIACGHSHLPRVVRLDDGRLIVNPGSVGLPAYDHDDPYPHIMEAGSPHARYAVLTDGPAWKVELITVEYDWESASRDAARAGRADWAHALRTGRALT